MHLERYLVTGASGFIGGAVSRKLLDCGAEVHGVSRSAITGGTPGWRHWIADLANPGQTEKLLDDVRPDRILHLAGCVTGQRELEHVGSTLADNLVAAVNILVASQRHRVKKIVLAGSLEEPPIDAPEPVPASPYAASKWAASGYARMFHALYGSSVAVAKIFMVYGPGQLDVDKLVPHVCLSAGRGVSPQIMSGNREVDWIHVDDVAEALVALAHKGPEDGSYVDIGSGQLVTTGNLASLICDLAGSGVAPELGALPDRPMEQVRRADAKATAALLNWRPKIDLQTGLRDTYHWYQEAVRCGQL